MAYTLYVFTVVHLYGVYFVLSCVLAAAGSVRRVNGSRSTDRSKVIHLATPMASFPSGRARRHSARVWPCSSTVLHLCAEAAGFLKGCLQLDCGLSCYRCHWLRRLYVVCFWPWPGDTPSMWLAWSSDDLLGLASVSMAGCLGVARLSGRDDVFCNIWAVSLVTHVQFVERKCAEHGQTL